MSRAGPAAHVTKRWVLWPPGLTVGKCVLPYSPSPRAGTGSCGSLTERLAPPALRRRHALEPRIMEVGSRWREPFNGPRADQTTRAGTAQTVPAQRVPNGSLHKAVDALPVRADGQEVHLALLVLAAGTAPERRFDLLLFFLFPVSFRLRHAAWTLLAADGLAFALNDLLGRPLPFAYAASSHLGGMAAGWIAWRLDRKSTRLNSSH